ncbi:MAG: lytic transglycosylase domain-containing protein [Burkholderiales bacterium]|nr:lytic transglycosylase domain-containing protein [Burkholderiales bacterium]
MKAIETLRATQRACARSLGVFARDVGRGFFEISHNTLALLGLAVVAVVIFGAGRADLRAQVELHALQWLQGRQETRALEAGDLLSLVGEQAAVSRATAVDPGQLSREQAAVAQWISRRYQVAPEPIGRLVQEAWAIGGHAKLDPTLILAIMAIESRFNPFAQSSVGAQGLMQVMTRVHDDKYQAFGGVHAAFDPLSNLRVGVQVLKDCIARAGSLYDGLRYYVGAANLVSDGGYAGRVMGEQANLKAVAAGRKLPVNAPIVAPPPPEREPLTAAREQPQAEQAQAPAAADKPAQLAQLASPAAQAPLR